MNIYCSECGRKLNENDVFCSECGAQTNVATCIQNPENTTAKQNTSAPVYTTAQIHSHQDTVTDFSNPIFTENKSKRSGKLKHITLISLSVAVIIFVCISICNLINPLSSGNIEEILNIYGQSAGKHFSDISVICTEPLVDVPGTQEGSEWHYVLCHGNVGNTTMYISYPIDIKNKEVADIQIRNPFLYALWGDILVNGDKDLNIEMFLKMKNHIQTGFDCFENRPSRTSQFLRNITGNGGIIPTTKAREIMLSCLPQVYGQDTVNKWHNAGEFHLLFEKGSANPKLITILSTTQQYRWPYPESFLNNLDSFQKAELSRVYGEPYKQKTVWRAALIDNETFNTRSDKSFTTLDALKEYYKVE